MYTFNIRLIQKDVYTILVIITDTLKHIQGGPKKSL